MTDRTRDVPKIVRVSIFGQTEREKLVTALAENGHKVWVEEIEHLTDVNEHFVCFELKPANRKDAGS
jgi:hypothetical protein